MSEILIFRFEKTDGPGYFGQFLDTKGIKYQLLEVDQGETIPTSIDGAPALVFMGGVMSANDRLDWISPVLELIRSARKSNIPMLGHCLGGQLISKALGGHVEKNPVEEIGWWPVDVIQNNQTPKWCRKLPVTLDVFHWHNETFSVPAEATHIFKSAACPNQGFQIGNTLALQFHLEILPEMVDDWASRFIDHTHEPGPTVQSQSTIIENLVEKAARSKTAADWIYDHWCSNLR